MRSTKIRTISVVLTAMLAVLIGSGTALSQGKGKHGGDRGGGAGRHDNGPQKQGRPQAQQPKFERPQAPQMRQQKQNGHWQGQNRQQPVFRPQPGPDRRQPMITGNDGRGGWNAARRDDKPRHNADRGRGNGSWAARYKDTPQIHPAERSFPRGVAWQFGRRNGPGYAAGMPKFIKKALKEDEKAYKREEKAYKRDLRDATRHEGRDLYAWPRYTAERNAYYEDRRRQSVLRNSIVDILMPRYADSYYVSRTPQYYAPPVYFDSYYETPVYTSYTGYVPAYTYGFNVYEPYRVTTYTSYPYYPDIYSDDFPYAYITSSAPGGSFLRQIFSQLVALGYDQGYSDGFAARRAGYREPDIYDPYAYDDAVYDPYSYSLGENRRCLSEGYELGYQDALNGSRMYDPYRDGNVDLVSVLISNVSVVL